MIAIPILIGIVISLVYLILLFSSSEKNEKRVLLRGFIATGFAGIVIHMIHFLDETDFVTALVWSVINSAELFIGDSHIETMLISAMLQSASFAEWFLPSYFTIYFCALVTSTFFILKLLFSRWLKNEKISLKYSFSNKQSHYNIFFESNEPTNILANELLGNENEEVIVISSPSDVPARRLNIMDLFMMDSPEENSFDSSQSKRFVTVTSKKLLKSIEGNTLTSIFKELKCRGVKKVIDNADLFFLSEDEVSNITLALKFSSLELSGKIFCHCRQEYITKYYAEAYSAYNIIFIDSSKLAFASLKGEKELYPINFVDVAKDSSGRKLGYVDSPFYSLILGFGQTGQEALSFLYEYGAFVGKNRERSKFHCVVYDREMERIKGSYVNYRPRMDKNLVTFRSVDVCSEEFWNRLNSENTGFLSKSFVSQVNYIVVSLGDDHTNLQVALELLEHIYKLKQKDLSKLVILVHLTNADKRDQDTLLYYQKKYSFEGRNIIFPFGDNESIWKMDLISNKPIIQAASEFYDSYQMASHNSDSQDKKSEILDTSAYAEDIRNFSEALFNKFKKNEPSEYKDFISGILSHQKSTELQQNVVNNALKLGTDPIGLAYFFVIDQKKSIKGFKFRRLRKILIKSLLIYVNYDIFKVSIAKGEDTDKNSYHNFVNALVSEVNKLDRQEAQDFSNTFHVYTKKQLADESIIKEAAYIENSYDSWKARVEKNGEKIKNNETEMSHYYGDDHFAEKAFEYLAIGEHLRWEASHAMLGYNLAKNIETDDLLKVHDCMIPYNELTKLDKEGKGVHQHYDWSVVKTSLIM